jgi:hypothetical protein
MRLAIIVSLLMLASSTPGQAENGEQEIRYLLESIGGSECTFTRNGSEHTAAEAEAHLAMKFDRAGSRITTAEQFVDRLATESSWTGKAYLMNCAGTSMPSRDWLLERLERYRGSTVDRDPA